MSQYSFLQEGIGQKIAKFLAPGGIGKLMSYTGAGTLAGHGVGGFLGFLYGVKVYKNKQRTLEEIEKEINDEETSSYKRRQLIDQRNLIMSMSDEEYRNLLISEFYRKGTALGGTIGTTVGAIAGRRG